MLERFDATRPGRPTLHGLVVDERADNPIDRSTRTENTVYSETQTTTLVLGEQPLHLGVATAMVTLGNSQDMTKRVFTERTFFCSLATVFYARKGSSRNGLRQKAPFGRVLENAHIR